MNEKDSITEFEFYTNGTYTTILNTGKQSYLIQIYIFTEILSSAGRDHLCSNKKQF